MTYISNRDPFLLLALQQIQGVEGYTKFGRNYDIDTGVVPADITNVGTALYVPPTEARIHDITGNAQDVGTLLESGTITTGGSTTQIIDSAAAFISSGVAAGDIVLNDTEGDHSFVLSVDSETQLTVYPMHHGSDNLVGDNYRVVNKSGTGAAITHITEGLLSDGSATSEFVINNGVTPVPTVNEYARINRAHTHGCGSNNKNVGDIDLTAQTDATITAKITAGKGQTEHSYYCVPKGKRAIIVGVFGSLFKTGAASDALCQITLVTNLWAILGYGDGETQKGSWGCSIHEDLYRPFKPYRGGDHEYDELTDIWLRVDNLSDNNSIVSGDIDLILVDK